MNANREHKNTVFTFLFNDPDKLRELYNALSGSNYDAGTKIEINTLEDVLFMDMLNDISFTIDDKVVFLVEHQSTLSGNLPIRFLMYIGRVYEKIIVRSAVYKQKLLKVPTPEFVVLYNGKAAFPDEKLLRLSDAFIEERSQEFGGIDLTVRVLNINAGRNVGIVKKCSVLSEYVEFIEKVRECNNAGAEPADAVTKAVKYCLNNKILELFLTEHSSEVLNMLKTEFNLDDAITVWKEEGREEGREEIRQTLMLQIDSLIKSGVITQEQALAFSAVVTIATHPEGQ
jgi:hypothetical protein